MVLRDLPRRLGLLGPGPARRVAADIALVGLATAVDLLLWGFDPGLRAGTGTVPVIAVLATTLPVFAVQLWRRRRPWLCYAAAWAYALLWSFLIPYQPFTALLLALYAVARHRGRGPALAGLVGVLPVIAMATASTASFHPTDAAGVVLTVLVWCVLYGMTWTVARFARSTARAAEAALAVADERLRLARELHDIVAHSVTGMVLQAAGVRRNANLGEDQLRGSLELIERTGTQAMRELRRLLGLLRAPDGDRPGASLAELGQLVELTEACQITVQVHENGDRRQLGSELDHVAFRVVQESLANVIKHGGRGSTVRVDLDWTTARLRIGVQNEPGEGPVDNLPTENSGLGLRGLAERLQAAGGTLSAEPAGEGFRVSAELPG